MTQLFAEDGSVVPATAIRRACVVVQRKTAATDGYELVEIGLVDGSPAKPRSRCRPLQEAQRSPTRVLREVTLAKDGDSKWRIRYWSPCSRTAERVDVIGTSRGKGFQGVREAPPLRRRRRDPRVDVPPRARFDRRLVVSLARRQGHARGWRMGGDRITVRNLKGGQVDERNNLLIVRRHSRRADRLRGDSQGDHREAHQGRAGEKPEGKDIPTGD